jgi:phospholipid/cholesterol/gamma-HCH transport system permease protein
MIVGKISYPRLVLELVGSTVRSLLRPASFSWENLLSQIRSIGIEAVPVAGLITLTAGFVLALVLQVQLSQLGKAEMVPSVLWVILTEQVVPVGVALVFTGRSVSALTAELGAMQVSEEIKALFTMGIDVVPFLLVPRFIAFQLMLPVVTLFCIYASLLGGWFLCGPSLQMNLTDYAYYALDGANFTSVMTALVKSALFGFMAATIAFYKGLNVRDGSREISEATTQSVVTSVVVITLANALVTSIDLV